MAGFGKLMRRLGYAKLDSYGLVATSDDRIIATRPGGVLDDGYGGRVVGWRVEDLAAAELQPWQPATRVSAPVKLAPMPMLKVPSAVPPPLPMLPKPAPLPAMTTAIATFKAPVVEAVEEEKSEDDWEWEIAVAKARAAADDAELAVARVIPIASARKPAPVVKPAPAPIVRPAPIAVAKPKFVAHDPITEVDRIGEDTQVEIKPVGKTVIPVPQLPSYKPGTRTTQPMAVVAAPRRFPKGTMPEVAPEKTRTDVAVAVAPAPVAAAKPSALPSLRQRQATRG